MFSANAGPRLWPLTLALPHLPIAPMSLDSVLSMPMVAFISIVIWPPLYCSKISTLLVP
jgi:hypothetical protein